MFCGFAMNYMLRINLNLAIVTMVVPHSRSVAAIECGFPIEFNETTIPPITTTQSSEYLVIFLPLFFFNHVTRKIDFLSLRTGSNGMNTIKVWPLDRIIGSIGCHNFLVAYSHVAMGRRSFLAGPICSQP